MISLLDMKRLLTGFAILILSLPSVGFAEITPPAATTEEVRAIADGNDAASAAENAPS